MKFDSIFWVGPNALAKINRVYCHQRASDVICTLEFMLLKEHYNLCCPSRSCAGQYDKAYIWCWPPILLNGDSTAILSELPSDPNRRRPLHQRSANWPLSRMNHSSAEDPKSDSPTINVTASHDCHGPDCKCTWCWLEVNLAVSLYMFDWIGPTWFGDPSSSLCYLPTAASEWPSSPRPFLTHLYRCDISRLLP